MAEARRFDVAIIELPAERFVPPRGFSRVPVARGSYAHWLRHLPLLPKGFFERGAYDQMEIALKRVSHMLALDEMNNQDTALLIQPMVYGNYGKDSASGNFFTRNIVTGERKLQGEFYQSAFDAIGSQGKEINSIAKGYLTALENVTLPMIFAGMSSEAANEKGFRLLELVGLGDRRDHKPFELSGGQQQRVAIARAIVTDPTLLLCDEPTGDLDRKSADEILDLLGLLVSERKTTILMVTHDPRAAERASALLHLEKAPILNLQRPAVIAQPLADILQVRK